MEGKYPVSSVRQSRTESPPVNHREESRSHMNDGLLITKPSTSTNENKGQQESKPIQIVHNEDHSQVDKIMASDKSVIRQEHNLDRKIDPPLPPPPSLEHAKKPSIPSPFEDTSWLAKEIEALLNKRSCMAISQFKSKSASKQLLQISIN